MSSTSTKLRVAIVGLGLIGGSLALALRKYKIADYIVGVENDQTSRNKSLSRKMVDDCCSSIAELPTVDLLVLASPVNTFERLAKECREHIGMDTTISDVGSTKTNLLEAFCKAYGELPVQLAPAHPIAGSEKSGIDAADPCLFTNAGLIMVPTPATGETHYQRVSQMWQKLQCVLVDMSSQHHDLVLAKTSHLPHLLSFAMVHYLASQSENYDIFRFAAGGFRDLTRMAASDPVMWSAVFCANQKHMLATIDDLQSTLSDIKNMIAEKDEQSIKNYIAEAKKARDYYASIMPCQ